MREAKKVFFLIQLFGKSRHEEGKPYLFIIYNKWLGKKKLKKKKKPKHIFQPGASKSHLLVPSKTKPVTELVYLACLFCPLDK